MRSWRSCAITPACRRQTEKHERRPGHTTRQSLVEAEGRKTPGFLGAHLMGSLIHILPDAPFTGFKDVDMNIVRKEGAAVDPQDFSQRGLIFECGLLKMERYRSAEVVRAEAIDIPLRPRFQPPAEMALRHGIQPGMAGTRKRQGGFFTYTLVFEKPADSN